MDQTSTVASPFSDSPNVFLIECFKCLRKYELHGRESILAVCLENEGWVRDGEKMICPWCLAPRDLPVYNRKRQAERRLKRCQS